VAGRVPAEVDLGYPNSVLKRLATAGVAIALGGGVALGVAACGEERGDVQIEGDTGTGTTARTGTAGKTGTAGSGDTSGTSTAERPKTSTSP
jgi:hypothetical protein